MNAITKTTVIFGTVIVFSSANLMAAGDTAVDFLNIGISARSAATGGAFSAVADGPASSYYNPAGLGYAEDYQISGMHSEWFQDLRYEYFGAAIPMGSRGGLGLSFSYLTYGDITGYSESNASTGNIDAYDMALSLSYGRQITPELSLGLGIKGISEKLDNISANGMAGDIGLQYRSGRYLGGISVMNIGPSLKYETSTASLPTTVNVGAAYYPGGRELGLLVGTAVPLDGDVSYMAGLEYSYQNLLILRGGYDYGEQFDANGGFSFGGGIQVSEHSLDYAYNINSLMGGTHQISFVFRFGQSEKDAREYSSEKRIAEPPILSVPEIEKTTEKAEDKSNRKYLIYAARYKDKASAQKHAATLRKFGLSAKIVSYDGQEYFVVFKEVKGLKKAEKAKADVEKKGISCFMQEI